MPDAIVCGCSNSTVPVKVVKQNSGIAKRFNPTDAAIFRTVIGYDDFEVLMGLIQDALDRLGNVFFTVVAGDDDAKLRHVKESSREDYHTGDKPKKPRRAFERRRACSEKKMATSYQGCILQWQSQYLGRGKHSATLGLAH